MFTAITLLISTLLVLTVVAQNTKGLWAPGFAAGYRLVGAPRSAGLLGSATWVFGAALMVVCVVG
ncbi:MAG: preprotein translocase subunit SecG [Flavobacteriales bacterium]|nr:MAG: preprotein translocase subunit SecG [Flavobacteriales bacterium]